MKKIILFLLFIPFLFFESCNTDFNINDPNHEDVYALNCILRNDTTIQYAILSKSVYTENGGYPTSGVPAQFIKGASVKILYNDSVFIMKDTTIQINNGGNIIRVNCYYIKDIIFAPGRNISIEATVPNGKILKSTIQIPVIIFNSKDYYRIPPGYSEANFFSDEIHWIWLVNNLGRTDIINQIQLDIYYQKNEGGKFIEKKINIPLGSFTIRANSDTPEFASFEPSYTYSTKEFIDIVNIKMQEISGNDPNKRNYIIEKAKFSVRAIDPLSSKNYSASSTYSQGFSIKLFPPENSNIEGGKGIFGMCYDYSMYASIDSSYVYSFGYKYKPH